MTAPRLRLTPGPRAKAQTLVLLAAALLLSGTSAWAGPIPTGTLSFTTPTGIVGPTDSVPVWLTIGLTPGSGSLQTDGSGFIVGLTFADFAPFLFSSSYTSADFDAAVASSTYSSNLNVYYGCGGVTFVGAGCISGGPYDFDFAYPGPGNPLAMVGVQNLSLADGSSTDYLFGTFNPTGGGPVAAGTYAFSNTGLFIQVFDQAWVNPDLDPLDPSYDARKHHVADIMIGRTDGGTPFERTVQGGDTAPVPEPGSMILLGTGLVGLAAKVRRRRK